MTVDDELQCLLRLSYPEIQALPESSARNLRDENDKAIQVIVWREQISPDTCRVLVSEHRRRWLGISSLNRAVGFIIESGGATEMLDTADVEQLFL